MESSTLRNSSTMGSFMFTVNNTLEYFGGCVCYLKDSTVSRVNGNLDITLDYLTDSVGDLSVGILFGIADAAVCNYIEVYGRISYTNSNSTDVTLMLGCLFGALSDESKINHAISQCKIILNSVCLAHVGSFGHVRISTISDLFSNLTLTVQTSTN